MELQELRNIVLENENVVEIHKNYFKVLTDYVKINDVMTLHDIETIKTVGDEVSDDIAYINVWFNNHCIRLSDIESLLIGDVRSYL